MTWFKLDDNFPRHPKVVRAGTDAAWLFVAGGCYCAQYLTDGLIPKDALTGLTALKQPAKLAQRLVDAVLWYDRGDCYEVHDYLVYNPSRDHVEKERRKAQERRANGVRTSGERRATETRETPAPDPTRPEVLTEPLETARKRATSPPKDYVPTQAQQDYCAEHGLDVDGERERWLTDCEAKGRTYKVVTAGFTTWLHHAVDFGRGSVAASAPRRADEVRRCKVCANTGNYVKNGVVTPCKAHSYA